MTNKILVVCDYENEDATPVSLQALQSARQAAEFTNAGIVLVVAGSFPETAAGNIAKRTGLSVLSVDLKEEYAFSSSVKQKLLLHLVHEHGITHVCFPHTSRSLDIAPGLAVLLNAASITGVCGVEQGKSELLFYRNVCGGNLQASVTSETQVTVYTVLPGCFHPEEYHGTPGEVLNVSYGVTECREHHTGIISAGEPESSLSDAAVVVAAGRGIGDRDNLHLIYSLRDALQGSAVAGSRPLIDSGWMEYRNQVGITGATVTPDVYIAVGISGSSQHLAGMSGSGVVISINSDSNAAMFKNSDICIVADAAAFLETFIKLTETEDP